MKGCTRMLSDKIKKTITHAAQALTGYKRRAFVAQVAIDYFDGSPRRTEREMGWCRDTVDTGINELRSNIRCLDDYSGRGNKRTEDSKHDSSLGNMSINSITSLG